MSLADISSISDPRVHAGMMGKEWGTPGKESLEAIWLC